MTEGIRFGGMEMLLERETELAMISSGLDGALAGEGSILVVEGEAGIGKSELLRVAAARAVDKGLWVMRARASELEHEYAYGVVRQLLVPVFAAMTRDAQLDVLAGAARLAGPVLGLGSADDPDRAAETVPDHGAVLHGLYWLTVNIAARQPLLISLDDAQWSDGRSLRFMAFLARRLEGLPIMVLLSIRAEDVAAALTPLSELATESLACKRVVRPQPLSEAAVRGLIGESLAAPAEDEFVRAFTKATGGVPFLVRELLKALAEDGVKPTGAAAWLLDQVSPQTVTTATMLRLARLGPTAIRAAQGIAVLGATATALRLSNLTDVPEPHLEAAVDALVSARILRAVPVLEFVHPLVQTSVYEDIPPSVSSAMHARAASLLAAMHSDPEQVAAHLLCTGPNDDSSYAELLVDAADSALGRGAPDAAATYLRHALQANLDGDLHGRLLYELGRCEQLTRDPAAITHLRAAIEAFRDPNDRARAALALGDALLYVGDLGGSRGVLHAALEDLDGEDRALAVALEALSAYVGYGDPRFNREVRADMSRLRRIADRTGSNARSLNVFLALVTATNGENGNRSLPRVDLGLDHGRLLKVETSDSIAVAVAVNVLVFVDELERADQLAVAMIDDARRRGLVLGFIAGSAHRGLVALRKGALAQAEAETRAALELAQQHELLFTIPFTLAYLGATMLERGDPAQVAELVEPVRLPPGFDQTLAGAMFRQIRGRSRVANGDRTGGIEDLSGAGEALEAIAMRNPNVSGWRSELALAIAPQDPSWAAELVETELLRAREAGSARAIGIALRASGLLKRGGDAITELSEAVTVLACSPAKLEHARALTDVGAALRRGNMRSSAREPLRLGLELASRCGAGPLVERARHELLACGGRPRRIMVTGRDALTASEQRIAELAARGDSNRDIAQALFITPKTVENHLGRIYRKLAINSREQLPRVLAAERLAD